MESGAAGRALAKIASGPDPLEVANGATQHMFIVNPLKKVGGGSARINRLRELTGERPLGGSEMRALARLP